MDTAAIAFGSSVHGKSSLSLLLTEEFAEHRAVLAASEANLIAHVMEAITMVRTSIHQGGKLLIFGNGGSAADAQHIAAEFLVRYQADRPALAALALTTDTSTLTACGNDLGFDALFERQIAGLGRAGDVALGITTSGSSPNVLKGLAKAKSLGLKTIALTGRRGGLLASQYDLGIVVPSTTTARIQEMHIMIGHMICKGLDHQMGYI